MRNHHRGAREPLIKSGQRLRESKTFIRKALFAANGHRSSQEKQRCGWTFWSGRVGRAPGAYSAFRSQGGGHPLGTSRQAVGMPLPAMDGVVRHFGNAVFAGAKNCQGAAGVPAQLDLEKRCKPDAIRT